MDWTSIKAEIFSGLLAILSILLGWAVKWAIAWLKTKAQNEKVRGALDLLDQGLQDGVKAAQQTIVNDAKAASEDGTLSKEEAENARNRALQAGWAKLGPAGAKALRAAFGSDGLEEVVKNKLEAKVFDAKQAASTSAPGTGVAPVSSGVPLVPAAAPAEPAPTPISP